MLNQIFETAKIDPAADVVGQVVDMFTVPGGATYAVLFVPDAFSDIVWLVSEGGLRSLSLTHGNSLDMCDDSVVPYEVTICKQPARPHCNVCYVSSEQSALGPWEYKRRLIDGTIVDTSWWDPHLDYVMAASAKAVGELAGATAPVADAAVAPVETDEERMKQAVMSIADEQARRTVVASMGALIAQSKTHQERADVAEKASAEQTARLAKLEEQLADAQMRKRGLSCSVKIFQNELEKMRAGMNGEIREAFQISEAETNEAFKDTTDDALGRQLEVLQRYVTACNFQSMMRTSAEVVDNSRAKRARIVEAPEPASPNIDHVFAASSEALRASQSVHQVGATVASAGAMEVESAAGPARSEAEVAQDQIFAMVAGMSNTLGGGRM